MSPKSVQGAQSFARNMLVLQIIADRPDPPDVAEILAQCDLTRPTLYRILSALEAEGLIVRSAARRYRVGPRLIGLAHRALGQIDVRAAAHTALRALRDDTGETVHLAVRNLDEMIYADKIESLESVRMASTIGKRVPFHSSAVGKAYLAALPVPEADTIIDGLPLDAVTASTTTDRQALRGKVVAARKRGFSLDEEENEAGIVCFGAPIRDGSGRPVASVSVSVPTFRLRAEKAHYWRPLVTHCAQVSRDLGFVDGAPAAF